MLGICVTFNGRAFFRIPKRLSSLNLQVRAASGCQASSVRKSQLGPLQLFGRKKNFTAVWFFNFNSYCCGKSSKKRYQISIQLDDLIVVANQNFEKKIKLQPSSQSSLLLYLVEDEHFYRYFISNMWQCTLFKFCHFFSYLIFRDFECWEHSMVIWRFIKVSFDFELFLYICKRREKVLIFKHCALACINI